MSRRSHSIVGFVLVLVVLAACAGGEDEREAGDDTAATFAAEEALAEEPSASVPDSIPMEVRVTFTGAPAGGDGTFTASGNGAVCVHDPDARAGQTDAEWTIHWAAEEHPEVKMVRMQIGKTGADNRSREMFVMLMAGEVNAMGMTVSPMYMIGTFPGGDVQGRGVAHVEREGEGVKIDLEGEAATYKTKINATVICRRLGRVD